VCVVDSAAVERNYALCFGTTAFWGREKCVYLLGSESHYISHPVCSPASTSAEVFTLHDAFIIIFFLHGNMKIGLFIVFFFNYAAFLRSSTQKFSLHPYSVLMDGWLYE
jgi:hypothetical protein